VPSSLKTFLRVLYALILREGTTRFGRNRLGYLWAFIEPAGYILIFVFGRAALQDRVPFGDSLILFALTGLMTFRIASSIANRARSAISSNEALLAYPLVRTLDLMVARILLEAATMVILFLMFLAGVALFGGVRIQMNPEKFCAAMGTTLLLGAGLGVFNAVIGRLLPVWERIWGLLSLPMFFTSGIFFLPSALPPDVMRILWWNPFLHCVEWMRDAVYLDYEPVLSQPYVLGFAISTLFMGLFANRYFQQQILDA